MSLTLRPLLAPPAVLSSATDRGFEPGALDGALVLGKAAGPAGGGIIGPALCLGGAEEELSTLFSGMSCSGCVWLPELPPSAGNLEWMDEIFAFVGGIKGFLA